MFSAPKQEEINHLTIKLVVGLIALSLAPLTRFFANSYITSISASYYEGGWSQSIFTGFLFGHSDLLPCLQWLLPNRYGAEQVSLSGSTRCSDVPVAVA